MTTVHFQIANLFRGDFMRAFREAAGNAVAIRFELSSFESTFAKFGYTAEELRTVFGTPSLLQKTTFVQNGKILTWNGVAFE